MWRGSRSGWRFAIVLLVSLRCGTVHGAVIDGFTSATNDRFADDTGFIASSFDLSGVAISDSGKWITMLSPNVFLTANHYAPGVGENITFYGSNDPAGLTLTRSVSNLERIGTSDLRIGILNSPLSAQFGYYDFATHITTNNNTALLGPNRRNSESFINSPYYLADAYVLGRSPSSLPTSQDMAVGQNKLDRWFDADAVGGIDDVAIGAEVNSPTEQNFLPYEADLRGGDSGGPLFVEEVPGELTLVGINWFISDPAGSFIGMSYVGNYATEIQSYIHLNAIPEPTILWFLVMAVMGLAAWRRGATRCNG